MITEYKKPKILFIEGVFLKDGECIDDMFEKQIIEQLDEVSPILYDKIPMTYTKGCWEKTNIKCWHCDLSFDNKPVFIPRIINMKKNKFAVGVYGCFCSFSCALSYVYLNYPNICDTSTYEEMLEFLFKIFYGKKSKLIKAPSKYIMSQYGGDCSIYEYKQKLKQLQEHMLKN